MRPSPPKTTCSLNGMSPPEPWIGSENNVETDKLRTRAEDYIHKPIAFGELLQHLRNYVALDAPDVEADPIMIDFWLMNAKLQSEGGDYRVRYTVDGGAPQFIDSWNPIWLTGWMSGKHTVKLELVDKNGQLVDNGGYNATTREINVVKK